MGTYERFTAEQIHRLITEALEGSDGFTAYAFDKPEHAGRYIVGGAGTILRTDSRNLYYVPQESRRGIETWAAENVNAETLGFWVDGTDVWFDAGDTWNTEYAAMVTARARGEIAIWDRATESEIRVSEAR